MSSKIKKIYDGKIVKLNLEEVTLPNGQVMQLEVIRHTSSAAIVPFSADRQSVLLLKQFRPAIQDWLWEIPAGLLDPDETPQQCAARELEEETGFVAQTITPLIEFYPTPGYSDEKLYIFQGTGLQPGEKRLETTEIIEEKFFSLKEVGQMLRERTITDPKTLIGLVASLPRLLS